MRTYVIIRSFRRKRNKKNEEYGWSVADYMLSEKLFEMSMYVVPME